MARQLSDAGKSCKADQVSLGWSIPYIHVATRHALELKLPTQSCVKLHLSATCQSKHQKSKESLPSRQINSVKNLCTLADASMRKIQLEACFPSPSTTEILLQSTQGNSRQSCSLGIGGGCARSTGYSTTFLSFALIQIVARLFALRLALDHADTGVALGRDTSDRLDLLAL